MAASLLFRVMLPVIEELLKWQFPALAAAEKRAMLTASVRAFYLQPIPPPAHR
jgi:hypothetical protein